MAEPIRARWVFDIVSPFAYLAFGELKRLPPDVEIEYVPVLLAALLEKNGQLGPAEIPVKRRFTYRFVHWRARRLGVPMRFPPAHPFSPLAGLRLIIAAGSTAHAVGTVLDAAFRDGRDLADPATIAELAATLGVRDPQATLADPKIKERLRENTSWAEKCGVFGVPTLMIGDELFWGHDALDMALDYLSDRAWFESAALRSVETLPVGVVRGSAQRPK